MFARNPFLTATVLLLIAVACAPREGRSPEVFIDDIPVCGTVQFSEGCSDELDPLIAYGFALIHHMTYEEADAVFSKVSQANEGCFWGPWGRAMSIIHPLWNDPPSAERFRQGAMFAQTAMNLAATEKEIAYARAVGAYYNAGPEAPQGERLKKFHAAWEWTFQAYPGDLEAKAFYALSLVAVADPADRTFANQLKAGALAEEVLQVIPDHPGAFHYIIHAYDYPALSARAIRVANTYGNIAPEIPHALHMPSHIFTRLGMWKESIDWNTRSAAAAVKLPVEGGISKDYFHAMDYLIYSHLQRGEVTKARALLQEMRPRPGRRLHAHNVTAYALAAGEARFHLERSDWNGASMTTLPGEGVFAWENFPEALALNAFARGLGAARLGPSTGSGTGPSTGNARRSREEVNATVRKAEVAIHTLDSLKASIRHPYFLSQIDVQKKIISAWLMFNVGKRKEALEVMRQACELEWTTEKHPVTPGELLPSREVFGDMLMEANLAEEALQQYEMTLQRSPNRLNSLYGAGRAAELSGDHAKAKEYYAKVAALTAESGDIIPKAQTASQKLRSL